MVIEEEDPDFSREGSMRHRSCEEEREADMIKNVLYLKMKFFKKEKNKLG